MSVLPIRIIGDDILRQKAEPIADVEGEHIKLAYDMAETMIAERGIGLAAPQVGRSVRLIVVDLKYLEKGDSPLMLINPEIAYIEGSVSMEEGCLSIPGLFAHVERPEKVVVRGLAIKNERKVVEVEISADDLYARVLLHEIDHLDGILFVDRLPLEERISLLAKWQKEKEKLLSSKKKKEASL